MTASTPYWLCPDAVFDGEKLLSATALCVADGLVSDLRAMAEVPPDARVKVVQGLLSPGFLDLQVNGGGDVLLNTTSTAAGMAARGDRHPRTAGGVLRSAGSIRQGGPVFRFH